MNFASVEKIADAILYEGYILYPYRAASTKNVQRWNFGTLYPRDYAETHHSGESYRMVTECLLQADTDAELDVRVRYLQLVRRQESSVDSTTESAASARAGNAQEWEEGVERSVEEGPLRLEDIAEVAASFDFSFNATLTVTDVASSGDVSVRPLSGHLKIRLDTIQPGLHKLTLELLNVTSVEDAALQPRSEALLQAFVSAHVLLGLRGGEFVSLLETPDEFREAAAQCRSVGVFPVLVGDPVQRSMMLASPIILYDYPQVAPESLGDFFDGTEMDEMLALRVLTLTDDEKHEMRNVDDRARKILERTETLPEDYLMKVHGAIRGLRPVRENSNE